MLITLINVYSVCAQQSRSARSTDAMEAAYQRVWQAFADGSHERVVSLSDSARIPSRVMSDTVRYVRWVDLLARTHRQLGAEARSIAVLYEGYDRTGASSLGRRLADTYVHHARYQEAREIYRHLHRSDTTDTATRDALARLSMRDRDWLEASHHLQALVGADSTNATWHARLARCYEERGRTGEAMDHLYSAHRLRPHDVDVALRLSALLRSVGVRDKAVRVVNASLDVRATDPRLWRRRANLAFEDSDLGTAASAYRQALAYGDSSATVYRRLGIVLAGRDRHAEAVPRLRAALARDSTSARTRLYLGISYRHLDSLDRSAALLQEAIDVAASGPITDAYVQLAQTEDARGDLSPALSSFRMARQLQPERAEILFRIAQLYDDYYRDKRVAARYYRLYLNKAAGAETDLVTYARRRLDHLRPILHMQVGPAGPPSSLEAVRDP
ncbi:tetratricopeptide repeat protein [Longibacter sp.]|jgi:tetratricopeptide (TPR) repeat protein|uniref:tetratricopeptide repeat protein n=1 Tax=Longibacter sp. TaxID=2045415 RepID=UPI003EBBD460